MNSTEDFNDQDIHLKKKELCSDVNSRDQSNEKALDKKVFIHKNSLLTDMMKINHFQTLYNICHIFAIFIIVGTFFYYKAAPFKMREDLDILKWTFSKPSSFLKYWLLYNFFAFAFYESFKAWINIRSMFQTKVVDKVFLCLYVLSYTLTFAVTAYLMFKDKFGVLLYLPACADQLRVYMKIHSFIRENVVRVLQHKPEKDGNQKPVFCPTRKQYWYFLFAPVTLYRDNYPRTEKIRWTIVFQLLFEVFLGVIFYYCLTYRFIDLFKEVGIRPFSKTENVLVHAASWMLGFVNIFFYFYSFCHNWHNLWAELLRFGYREFYQDWWNCTTLGQYYRKWNVFVRDWLYYYVSKDLQAIGFSRRFSTMVAFLMTALFHEYALFMWFRFFIPVFAICFGGWGCLSSITRGRTSQSLNFFLLTALIFSMYVNVYFYTLEWYARQNCPKEETFIDYFIPRITDPSCHIFTS